MISVIFLLLSPVINKYNENITDEFDSSKIKEIFSKDSIEKIYELLENDKTELKYIYLYIYIKF